LYVLSDGLYEVPNANGELWGQERLEKTVRLFGRRTPTEVVSDTIAEAIRWQGHEHFPDDVALMVVELSEEVSHERSS
jgi:sigma-B regulation protein RsbU (phosphoserine phosphatase)